MNKGIKPRFWTALNRKWSRTEQEYETSANNFLLAQLGEVSCGKISKTKCWTGIRDKCKQFFACATWRSFLWRHKQSEMLNKNARQEERISHIWLIKRNFFVYCVGIQCRHLPTSQPPLLWPSKCHFDISPFQDFLLLYLSGLIPTSLADREIAFLSSTFMFVFLLPLRLNVFSHPYQMPIRPIILQITQFFCKNFQIW